MLFSPKSLLVSIKELQPSSSAKHEQHVLRRDRVRGLLPDLQCRPPLPPGAPLQTQLLRELPAGLEPAAGARTRRSAAPPDHLLPAVPGAHRPPPGGERQDRAECGRGRPGAAAGCRSPGRGGRAGGPRESSRGGRLLRGRQRREAPEELEESVEEDQRQELPQTR